MEKLKESLQEAGIVIEEGVFYSPSPEYYTWEGNGCKASLKGEEFYFEWNRGSGCFGSSIAECIRMEEEQYNKQAVELGF